MSICLLHWFLMMRDRTYPLSLYPPPVLLTFAKQQFRSFSSSSLFWATTSTFFNWISYLAQKFWTIFLIFQNRSIVIVFQSYELRFSGQICLFLIRLIMIIFSTIGQKWRWIPPLETSPDTTKTPEMNELETDTIFRKIWAHNFSKQKNPSNLIRKESVQIWQQQALLL